MLRRANFYVNRRKILPTRQTIHFHIFPCSSAESPPSSSAHNKSLSIGSERFRKQKSLKSINNAELKSQLHVKSIFVCVSQRKSLSTSFRQLPSIALAQHNPVIDLCSEICTSRIALAVGRLIVVVSIHYGSSTSCWELNPLFACCRSSCKML